MPMYKIFAAPIFTLFATKETLVAAVSFFDNLIASSSNIHSDPHLCTPPSHSIRLADLFLLLNLFDVFYLFFFIIKTFFSFVCGLVFIGLFVVCKPYFYLYIIQRSRSNTRCTFQLHHRHAITCSTNTVRSDTQCVKQHCMKSAINA